MDASYRYTEALENPTYNVGGVEVETEYSSHNVGLGLRYNFFDAKYGVQDEDGDGVADDADQCPGTPAGVQVDAVGCPLDGDKDGVADYLDQCLNTPAGAEVDDQGCELDSDNDGVVDANDMCPDTPAGTEVMSNGCGADQSVVLRGVNFETNSSKLTINAESILNGVAGTLNESTGFDVELQGHTDSVGNDSYNMSLSKKRANSVKNYLIGQGVEGNRLVARGYGEEQPVASNDSSEGRALNRRVELKVLGQTEEPVMVEDYSAEETMVEDAAAEDVMMDEAEITAPAADDSYLDEAEEEMEAAEEEVEEVEEEYDYDYNSSSDEIDYDF
ncbi:OmpA family protein [Spongiibacter sp. KMU-158]|uniref:OmpA family protein n=1 Tax=Spongiibacter pelagi TaxID=2760804 RepID=A0A927BY10_9GAMM|nr:OmpA family protein [Spongiibacter pelagi]